MLYSYFFNMLKVGVPGFTQVPQLLVYNQKFALFTLDRKVPDKTKAPLVSQGELARQRLRG